MSIELLGLVVSIISALAAIAAIPDLPATIARVSPWLGNHFPKITVKWAALFAVLTAVMVAAYVFVFYPCPWYQIENLKSLVAQETANGQWTLVEGYGQRLCDCGDQFDGWSDQGNSEYRLGEYHTAINFWNRAERAGNADPIAEEMLDANIADADIWQNDFPGALKISERNYARNADNYRLRYAYGRALVFSGDFNQAVGILQGLPRGFGDAGSTGEAEVFEAIARLGDAPTLADALQPENIETAKKELCDAMARLPDWRSWLFDPNSDVGHLTRVRLVITRYFDGKCTS